MGVCVSVCASVREHTEEYACAFTCVRVVRCSFMLGGCLCCTHSSHAFSLTRLCLFRLLSVAEGVGARTQNSMLSDVFVCLCFRAFARLCLSVCVSVCVCLVSVCCVCGSVCLCLSVFASLCVFACHCLLLLLRTTHVLALSLPHSLDHLLL